MDVTQTDPYAAARMRGRFGNPSGAAQSGYQSGGGASPYSPASGSRSPMRQRLPIMPDQSEHPSVSPAGQGSSSGSSPQAFAAGAEQEDQLRKQIQQSTAARATQMQAQTAAAQRDPNSAGSPAAVAAYRQARDTSPGAVAAREQTQESVALGIDPSSSPKDIAAAASGPIRFNGQGMPSGGATQQAGPSISSAGPQPPASTAANVQPNGTDMRNAVLRIQAGKDGQQNSAEDQAYAKGYGPGVHPFAPAAQRGMKNNWAGPDSPPATPTAPAGSMVASAGAPNPNATTFSTALAQQRQGQQLAPTAPVPAAPGSMVASNAAPAAPVPSAPDPNATTFSTALAQQRQRRLQPGDPGYVA